MRTPTFLALFLVVVQLKVKGDSFVATPVK